MSSAANPRHPNNPPSDPPAEPTGAVAKDSLAAESIASGEGFAENQNPEVLGVKGANSTLANTDTTNAETLPPGRSGTVRDGQDTTKYPDSGAAAGFTGTHSDQGYRGGSSNASVQKTSTSGTTYSSAPAAGAGSGTRPYVESAPGYTADTATTGDMKPKGKNITEDEGIPAHRSTFTGDVGGPNDPGRLAEAEFARGAADASGGLGARQYGNVEKGGDDNIYDTLKSNERA